MKKAKMAMAMGAIVLVLSACGQTGNQEEIQTNVADNTVGSSDSGDRGQEVFGNGTAGSADGSQAERREGQQSAEGNVDVLESLTGEYEYISDDGTGRLTIKKTSYGYDISDYEPEDSWRFLADSSNIETMEDGSKVP